MNNLERLRISKNLSRPKLSEISGVPSSTINKLEKGFNNIKAAKGYTLHKLAVAMNTTIEYLINDGDFNEHIDKESYELKNKAFEDFSYLIEKYGDLIVQFDNDKFMKLLINTCDKVALEILKSCIKEYFSLGFQNKSDCLSKLSVDDKRLKEIQMRWSIETI